MVRPLKIYEQRCETVGKMISQDVEVRATCSLCRRHSDVDLHEVAAVKGMDYCLFGQRARCKQSDCGGSVFFMFKLGVWRPMLW